MDLHCTIPRTRTQPDGVIFSILIHLLAFGLLPKNCICVGLWCSCIEQLGIVAVYTLLPIYTPTLAVAILQYRVPFMQ